MSASARIDSPHLAHPQQATDFKLEVVDESADNGRAALLQQAGAFADDETLPQLLAEIYAERGRPEVPDTDEGQS